MKTLLSGSFSLLLIVAMLTLSLGCGEGIEGETGSRSTGLTAGDCNALVANVLGTAQQCNQFGCGAVECGELLDAFLEFFVSPGECGIVSADGELNGLPGNAFTQPGNGPNAGGPQHIQEVICGSAAACGLCETAQSQGICITTEACNNP